MVNSPAVQFEHINSKELIMSRKSLIAVGLSIVLVMPMFASDTKEMKQPFSSQQHCKMTKENHMHGDGLFFDLKRLKLSDDQKKQVRLIIKEQMKNMPNPNDAFTDNSFDKAMYIKLEQQKRDSMIESKADMMEKVYNILNDTQKKELKEILEKHKNHFLEKK